MKSLRSHFNQKQLDVFQKVGYELSDEKDYSDDEMSDMEEKISVYFQMHGLGDNDGVNSTGQICESIMDIFSEIN